MKKVLKVLSIIGLLFSVNSQAALVNFELTGNIDLLFFDPFGGLTNTISATGSFEGNLLTTGTDTIYLTDLVITAGNATFFDTASTNLVLDGSNMFLGLNYTSPMGDLVSIGSSFSSNSDFMGAWDAASYSTSTVPVPAAAWLFGSGLIALVGFVRRKK